MIPQDEQIFGDLDALQYDLSSPISEVCKKLFVRIGIASGELLFILQIM